MEMRRSESLDMGVHACMSLFILFVLGVSETVCTVVCVCVCGGGGHYLHQCVTVGVFVSAAMHHIQHMLPSSSPFRGRLSHDTQQDSLTWSRGTTWGHSPRGHGSLREFQHPGKWHEQISRFTWTIFQKEALFVFPNQHEEGTWLRASFHFWSEWVGSSSVTCWSPSGGALNHPVSCVCHWYHMRLCQRSGSKRTACVRAHYKHLHKCLRSRVLRLVCPQLLSLLSLRTSGKYRMSSQNASWCVPGFYIFKHIWQVLLSQPLQTPPLLSHNKE